MLVLIAGVTGNIGQKLITSLISRGHAVRALARNASKLSPQLQGSLESFVQSTLNYDIAALDKACAGVEAVICAYTAIPELQLEGQLLLVRAVERAGVHRQVAASWSMDWRHTQLGQQESYDGNLLFRRQVELMSNIKPIYIFTGVLHEVFFSVAGHPAKQWAADCQHYTWNGDKKEVHIYGTGIELYPLTTEQDAAEFTMAILGLEDAQEQQYWNICSTALSLPRLAEIYGKVRGCEVSVLKKGSSDDPRRLAWTAQTTASLRDFWSYQLILYLLHIIDGAFQMSNYDNERLGVATTSLEEFLKANPEI